MKQVNMKKDIIKNVLTKIKSELDDLHMLLNKEKELLNNNDFENITAVAEQKKHIITNIEVDDVMFKELLKAEDFDNNGLSVHDIITRNVLDSTHLWVEIEKLLKTCKDKNSINGIILSNNRRQIQERISILQGQSNEMLIYGSTGESVVSNSTSNNPLSV